ncbi:MAG: hypothetical protein HQM15_09910 [Deltaproteobacteria bacterium]|nr:hypothetical protein [Deltaproteobacteria bacterium]
MEILSLLLPIPERYHYTAPEGNGLYEFYSGACDHVGNCENIHDPLDARTTVQAPVATPTAAIAVTPGPLTFPATNIGASSAPQTLTLRNTGTATLNLASVTLSGDAASQFALTLCHDVRNRKTGTQ